MMTISDIFDALVAWDRPYKKSVPVERALDILRDEAGTGSSTSDLLQRLHRGQDLRDARCHARRRGRSRALTSAPLVIAHRGDSAHRPENTLASFASALEVGRRRSSSSTSSSRATASVVVIHDATLDRTTNGRARWASDARRAARALGRLPERFGATTPGSGSRPWPRSSRSLRGRARVMIEIKKESVTRRRRRAASRPSPSPRSAGRGWPTTWPSSPSTGARSCAAAPARARDPAAATSSTAPAPRSCSPGAREAAARS